MFTHLDFADSFLKYGAWNETEQNIDSVFGVSVQVSYMFLRLDIQKEVFIFHQPPGFQEGLF
jgi:hypothetical protein